MKKLLPAVMSGALLLAASMPAHADTDSYSFVGLCAKGCGKIGVNKTFTETVVLTNYTGGSTFGLQNYVSFTGRFIGNVRPDLFGGQLPVSAGGGDFYASRSLYTGNDGFVVFDIFESKPDGTWFNEVVNEQGVITFDYTGTGAAWKLTSSISQPATPVPEPDAYSMLIVGLGLVGVAARCRKPATLQPPV
jgi:hypothetical protein